MDEKDIDMLAAPELTLDQAAPATARSRLLALLAHPRTPLVVGGGLLVGLLALVALPRLDVVGPLGRPAIVVFDPVKFMNAQRAAASIMALSPNADLALTLTQVAKQAEAVIKEEAHGAVVLVRQSVVVPDDLPDITNTVLARFGLPTTVPTVTTRPGVADSLDSVAPTDSAFSSGKLREDYRLELQARTAQLTAATNQEQRQQNLVP